MGKRWGRRPRRAFVDRGYRGHGVETADVFISGQRRGTTPALRRDLRRRSAPSHGLQANHCRATIEPAIGHMKTDGRLARCPLKSSLGDALHAVLCGCGHNIRMILAHLTAVVAEILELILRAIAPLTGPARAALPRLALAA